MSTGKSFKSLGLSEAMVGNLTALGYLKMTPIQAEGLPYVLEGRDVIGQANTGSGKTAAFALGILARLDVANPQPQALVLCPTRELAEQVCAEIRRLARFTANIKVLTLAGGSQERHQLKSLKQGAHILVGTPGRIMKFLDKGMLRIAALKVLVLDEADRLLELGFQQEIERIAALTPISRQTLLFSATFPNGIKALSATLQDNPAQVTVDSQHQKNPIRQLFIPVKDEASKLEALLTVLGHFNPESCLIFCNSRVACAKVAQFLKKHHVSALEIHSDLEQQDRTLVLTKFANRSCCALVATDLASRGLDIKEVAAVVNFDVPSDHELYVHRIGRTGRAGQKGLALSLFLEKERAFLTQVENYLKITCEIFEIDAMERSKTFAMRPVMTTIYISGGRKDNIRPGDILGALTKDAGLAGTDVGQIKILEVNSYVAIVSARVDAAVAHFQTGKIKGRKFKVGKV